MFRFAGAVFFFVIFSSVNCDLDLPSSFPRCYKNDPNLNQCLLKATDEVKPFLVAGVPELSMPPLPSLHIPELILEQNSGGMSFKAKLKNAVATGYDTYKFSQFNFVDMNRFEIKYVLKYVDIETEFELTGHALQLPLEAKGHLSANLTDIHTHGTIFLEEVTKNNVKYFQIKNVEVDVEVKDINVDVGRLFGGNGVIEKAAHAIIHENKDLFLKEFSQTTNKIIEKVTERQVFAEIFQVPIHKLFPEK